METMHHGDSLPKKTLLIITRVGGKSCVELCGAATENVVRHGQATKNDGLSHRHIGAILGVMNRRQFLLSGVGALAAYADQKPRRVGLIGSGWYGKIDLIRL